LENLAYLLDKKHLSLPRDVPAILLFIANQSCFSGFHFAACRFNVQPHRHVSGFDPRSAYHRS
jgi:hypothetical protein